MALDERQRSFFNSFPNFQLSPTSDPVSEFGRLAAQRHWGINTTTWRKNWQKCCGQEYHNTRAPLPKISNTAAPSGASDRVQAFARSLNNFRWNLANFPLVEYERLAAERWPFGTKSYMKSWKRCFGAPYPFQEISDTNTILPSQHNATSFDAPSSTGQPTPSTTAASDGGVSLGSDTGLDDDFFRQFEALGFERTTGENFSSEARRLAESRGLRRGTREYKDFIQQAFAHVFDKLLGTDADNLEKWQALCQLLGVLPVPQSIKKCKLVSVTQPFNI